MPTRKQRKRRQKELRHEYEYVYVDAEGQEVEVDEDELEPKESRRNGSRDAKPKPKAAPAKKNGKPSRPVREVQPPSWRRVARRALIFGPLIFIAFTVLNKSQPVLGRLAVAALYTGFFVPFMYLMDRALYRSYLRKTGQQPAAASGRKRR